MQALDIEAYLTRGKHYTTQFFYCTLLWNKKTHTQKRATTAFTEIQYAFKKNTPILLINISLSVL